MDVLNFGLFAPKKKTADSITGIQSQVNALLAGAGIFEGVANTYAELPDAALHSSRIWTVKTATGFPFINKRESGLYLSDGASWVFLDSSNTELAKYTVNGDSLDIIGLRLDILKLAGEKQTFVRVKTASILNHSQSVFVVMHFIVHYLISTSARPADAVPVKKVT